MIRKLISVLILAILIGFVFSQVYAEDITKKFILSFNFGNYATVDEIRSTADNRAYYMDGETVVTSRIDPRPDVAATNVLKIQDSFQALLGISYGFTPMFLIQTEIGYAKANVGEMEVTVLFPEDVDPEAAKLFQEKGELLFRLYELESGSITKIPIQTSAIVRFRPKSNFNPFLGAGIGYIVVKYEPSAELNQFSYNIDHSIGAFREAGQPEWFFHDLGGVKVDAPSSLEYHFLGGFDYTFKKHWSVYMDARYIFAARGMKFTVDGVQKFGEGFPNGRIDNWTIIPPDEGEPYQITEGGAFDFNKDGVLDGGLYYVNGGSIKYGGFSLSAGIKYTF